MTDGHYESEDTGGKKIKLKLSMACGSMQSVCCLKSTVIVSQIQSSLSEELT